MSIGNTIKYGMLFFFLVLLSCNGQKKYHSNEKEITNVSSDKLRSILEHQQEMNEEFRNPETSPLPDRFRKNFEGLDFFAPDTTYVVRAKFVQALNTTPFLMPTTTNVTSEYMLFGTVHFKLQGNTYTLEVYQNQELMLQEKYKDYLFLPFLDNTNGKETYGGGRYIDLAIPEGDFIEIDFNKAYNPYCAYNKKFSCPIVPAVNTLNMEVNAGVKAFKK
ncbi:DUF1684 domain-containing protein [Cellulophaga sp. F20128]|uniref:DUF1684 domain-containing protein n=1 Tax=Cellulophaga sp. F20128 TaxID=2926413 RepID=UPI001FF4A0DE|nr:DUF1684 domain-containing protein [Cellulophaga sp. F20128]MCK0158509.1 DUF1684 domain-containing protein [Cellulophaga sp. F20128]